MKAAAVAAAMGVMAAGLSCKGTAPTGPDGSPSTIIFPVKGVSYGAQVQPLFNQACNPAGCHDAGQHQSQLDLTTYDQAVLALPGVVVAGKPDASTLVLRIQGSVGARMPPGNYPLNQNQINGIRTWIVEGAKNN
jgi:hypothetical protein